MVLGRVLTSEEYRDRRRISRQTEWRERKRGEGPPRLRIDGKRWGYPENLFEQWLLSRLEATSSQ